MKKHFNLFSAHLGALTLSIFLFFCAQYLTVPLAAQVPYTPFPKEKITWQISGAYTYQTMDGTQGYIYNFEETSPSDKASINYFHNSEHICDVREENKKIYIDVPGFGEHILYDFGLEIGDTLFYNIGTLIVAENRELSIAFHLTYDNERNFVVVKNKDIKTLENGEVRNTLIVDLYIWKPDGGLKLFNTLEWVEGVGTISTVNAGKNAGFFDPINLPLDDQNRVYLVCISQNNSCLYQSDFHLSLYQCTICSFNQINEKNEIQILLYPNPTTGELNITSYELRIKGVEIYDIYGRKVGEKLWLS